jgi:glycerol uptake facilitator-like aquaporin
MFVMMVLSYAITAFIDLKSNYKKQDKVKLAVYFTLMAISCAIGSISGYAEKMPSPAEPIKNIVFTLMGK